MAGESASIHSRQPWECDVDVNVNASGIGHRKLRRMLHPGATKKPGRNKKRARQRSLFLGCPFWMFGWLSVLAVLPVSPFSAPQCKKPRSFGLRGFLGCKSLTMTYFHTGTRTIIGAKSFHCPVRDGKEWYQLAMVIRHNLLSCCSWSNTTNS